MLGCYTCTYFSLSPLYQSFRTRCPSIYYSLRGINGRHEKRANAEFHYFILKWKIPTCRYLFIFNLRMEGESWCFQNRLTWKMFMTEVPTYQRSASISNFQYYVLVRTRHNYSYLRTRTSTCTYMHGSYEKWLAAFISLARIIVIRTFILFFVRFIRCRYSTLLYPTILIGILPIQLNFRVKRKPFKKITNQK